MCNGEESNGEQMRNLAQPSAQAIYPLTPAPQGKVPGRSARIGSRNTMSREKRLEFDLWHVDNWAVALDLLIIGMTIGTKET